MATAPIVRKRIVVERSILSLKHGGGLDRCDSYCLYYRERPKNLDGMLCFGCPDRERCSSNLPNPVKLVWLFQK